MSHLPASQPLAEPGTQETVSGCLPMRGSESGQGLAGQRKAGMGQRWPEASEGPHSSSVLVTGTKEGPSPGSASLGRLWEPSQAWLGPAPDDSWRGLVKRPVPSELSQDAPPPDPPHGQPAPPSVSSLLHVFVFFLSKSPLGNALICLH